jgi:hypothetical protein
MANCIPLSRVVIPRHWIVGPGKSWRCGRRTAAGGSHSPASMCMAVVSIAFTKVGMPLSRLPDRACPDHHFTVEAGLDISTIRCLFPSRAHVALQQQHFCRSPLAFPMNSDIVAPTGGDCRCGTTYRLDINQLASGHPAIQCWQWLRLGSFNICQADSPSGRQYDWL